MGRHRIDASCCTWSLKSLTPTSAAHRDWSRSAPSAASPSVTCVATMSVTVSATTPKTLLLKEHQLHPGHPIGCPVPRPRRRSRLRGCWSPRHRHFFARISVLKQSLNGRPARYDPTRVDRAGDGVDRNDPGDSGTDSVRRAGCGRRRRLRIGRWTSCLGECVRQCRRCGRSLGTASGRIRAAARGLPGRTTPAASAPTPECDGVRERRPADLRERLHLSYLP